MRIVRMLYVRDEADVLPRNLAWYERMGLPTVVIDDGSTDGTTDMVTAAHDEGSVAAWRRLETEEHDLPRLLDAVLELGIEQDPDALVLTGADEFFEVADGAELVPTMVQDFEDGYNVLRFANMEFAMTPLDDPNEPDPLRRMRYYGHRRTTMLRAYRHVEGMSLAEGLSHQPSFPSHIKPRVSPRRYVSRHYPLRSLDQVRRKIERIRPTYERPTSSVHYLHLVGNEEAAVLDPEQLATYREDHNWDYTRRLRATRTRELQRAFVRLLLEHEELEGRYERLRRESAHALARLRAGRAGNT